MLIKITISKNENFSLNNLNNFLNKLKKPVMYLKTVSLSDIELEIETPHFIKLPSNLPIEYITIQDPWNTLTKLPVTFSDLKKWSKINVIEETTIEYNNCDFSYYTNYWTDRKSKSWTSLYLNKHFTPVIISMLGKTSMDIRNFNFDSKGFYNIEW